MKVGPHKIKDTKSTFIKKKKTKKKTIGRREKIDIPPLHLYELDAKVDTGAYTCSIHCNHIREVKRSGVRYVEFNLLDPSHPQYQDRKIRVSRFEKRKIKNSFGQSEKRFIIETYIRLFGKSYKTEFSLTDRGSMKYPVLLGRQLLEKRFIVDVGKYNLSYRYSKKKKKRKS